MPDSRPLPEIKIGRLSLMRKKPWLTNAAGLRRREFRVLDLRWWLLIYTPRDHWTEHL